MRNETRNRQKKELIFAVMNRFCQAYVDFPDSKKTQYKPILDYNILRVLQLSLELQKPLRPEVRTFAIEALTSYSTTLFPDFRKRLKKLNPSDQNDDELPPLDLSAEICAEVELVKSDLEKKYAEKYAQKPLEERGPKPTSTQVYSIVAKRFKEKKNNRGKEIKFDSVRKCYKRFCAKRKKLDEEQQLRDLQLLDMICPEDTVIDE